MIRLKKAGQKCFRIDVSRCSLCQLYQLILDCEQHRSDTFCRSLRHFTWVFCKGQDTQTTQQVQQTISSFILYKITTSIHLRRFWVQLTYSDPGNKRNVEFPKYKFNRTCYHSWTHVGFKRQAPSYPCLCFDVVHTNCLNRKNCF